jgi:hypothetical protein
MYKGKSACGNKVAFGNVITGTSGGIFMPVI